MYERYIKNLDTVALREIISAVFPVIWDLASEKYHEHQADLEENAETIAELRNELAEARLFKGVR